MRRRLISREMADAVADTLATTAVDAAAAAVERVRKAAARVAVLDVDDAGEVHVRSSSATEEVGGVASALGSGEVAFVYGAIELEEAKGGLEVASLGRRKLVLLTWIGEAVPARERGRAAERRAAVRALPNLLVHVELQANTPAEAEQASIIERVKVASGAFYDSGGAGTDQTVESTRASGADASGRASATDAASKPKPKGGRRLVKKGGA